MKFLIRYGVDLTLLAREWESKMSKLYLIVLDMALLSTAALGQHWQVTQITDGSQRVQYPSVSGSSVVWQQHDGHDWEIHLYDGSTIKQLTDNDVNDTIPDVADGHVAWYRGEYDDTDIVYDGTTIVAGVKNQTDMKLEPGGLIWSAATAPDFVHHVYLFDGTVTKRLSVDGTMHNHNPDMSGDKVVWSSFKKSENSAYLYDGANTVELPENVGLGQVPRISGNNIVGVGIDADGGHDQVFLYDGVTNKPLGNTSGHDILPRIAGENVAWSSCVNSVCEIFTYQDGQAKQLSFNSVRTYAPLVSEFFVFFNVYNGSDFEIFIYDGVNTVQFTDNDVNDTLYDNSGNTFVWTRSDRKGSQIFMATYVVPEPASLILLMCGAWTMALRRPNY
jgi:beta propeller repeat protein